MNSSESFFLRFSGLDLHARMLTHQEDEIEINNIWSNEYEDYTMGELNFELPKEFLIEFKCAYIMSNLCRQYAIWRGLC